MSRSIPRTLAAPAALAILLAGCASNEEPTPEPAASDADTAAPMEDAWPEVDDDTPPGPFAPDGAVGGTLDGAVYTLGALEPLPDDIASLIQDAGYAEKDMEGIMLLPVHIDNSQGTETEGMNTATAVTEDGEQYSYDTLSGFLYDVSEGYAEEESSGMGDPVYDDLWDRYEEESVEVAPTAQGDGYIVVEGVEDPGSVRFTYFAIEPPMYGEPISMAPVE